MGELAREIGEGNIANKVKKENKIEIKERPRSLFYTTFRGRKSKPRREKEQKKKGNKKKQQKKRRKKKLPIELFPLYSPESPLQLG